MLSRKSKEICFAARIHYLTGDEDGRENWFDNYPLRPKRILKISNVYPWQRKVMSLSK